jgi:hypothetical protein
MKVQRGIGGITPLFLQPRRQMGGWFTPRPGNPRKRDPVPVVQKAGWVPGPSLKSTENIAPTGFRSLDLPARSRLLYSNVFADRVLKLVLLEELDEI